MKLQNTFVHIDIFKALGGCCCCCLLLLIGGPIQRSKEQHDGVAQRRLSGHMGPFWPIHLQDSMPPPAARTSGRSIVNLSFSVLHPGPDDCAGWTRTRTALGAYNGT